MTGLLSFFGTRFGLFVALSLAAFGLYLIVTHTGHFLTALPYLILIACPLLHLFGHSHGQGQPK
jgi:hypothetical protein